MSHFTSIMTFRGLLICSLATCVEGAVQYTVTVLNPGGGIGATPYGVNDAGQVVGVMFTAPSHACLYENGGPMRDLGSLTPTRDSVALAINSHGQIAGYAQNAYTQHAVVFSGDGSIQDLGTLGGSVSSARGINDLGQVVGSADTADGYRRAFVYSQQQGMQDLGTLGGSGSGAHAINNAGAVVGLSNLPGMSAYHAFRYTAADGMRDLGTLGGLNSVAMDINSAGQVVGYSDLSSPYGLRHAVLWNPDGSMTDLGSLSSYYSEAKAINDVGLVVGESQINDLGTTGQRHAFIWNGSTMLDLNDLVQPFGGVLYGATDINSAGQIVAFGSFPGYGSMGAFLLTPVPEPATLMVLSAGLFGILARRRRGWRMQ